MVVVARRKISEPQEPRAFLSPRRVAPKFIAECFPKVQRHRLVATHGRQKTIRAQVVRPDCIPSSSVHGVIWIRRRVTLHQVDRRRQRRCGCYFANSCSSGNLREVAAAATLDARRGERRTPCPTFQTTVGSAVQRICNWSVDPAAQPQSIVAAQQSVTAQNKANCSCSHKSSEVVCLRARHTSRGYSSGELDCTRFWLVLSTCQANRQAQEREQ